APARAPMPRYGGGTASMERLPGGEPHVLVLDDVHWADDATMLLLGHVVPEIRRSRLLIVCTYRDAEMRRTPRHLAQVVRADERLVLRGLDRTESARVVADTASASVPADLLARLHRVSGGNPYFLGELVRWLRAQDGLAAADLSCTLPDEMRELTRRRLAPLGAEIRSVLTIAAAIGEDFDLRVLEGAIGLPADQLSERLAVATRDGFVRSSPRGPLHLEFVHAIV